VMVGFVPDNSGRWGLLGIHQGIDRLLVDQTIFCGGIGNGIGTHPSNAAAPAPSKHEA
jgi:hypothetical protein